MKKAALFNGALVTPNSGTLGTLSGRGVGSTRPVAPTDPGWNELIVRGSAEGGTGNIRQVGIVDGGV